ncbi:hypothetical protein [Limnohabitans sp. DM1]|uniref:hypothetical protein n=1 Tax=Limnohabitans sp. DM1 TaxID=1597955 RepID=UPI001892A475|nr:hypothetical protein [Limnohabitans sp. DM1]
MTWPIFPWPGLLISNQSTGVAAWTKYFAGQTKCARSDQNFAYRIFGCGTIQTDGRILWKVEHSSYSGGIYSVTTNYSEVPYQNNTVTYSTMDGATFLLGLVASPITTNDQRLNGLQPGEWTLLANGRDTYVDGGSRP